MTAIDPQAADVVNFWIEAGREAWFRKDDAFDARFRDRFLDLHYAASRRALDGWMDNPAGALALVILLDQLPRNCFRGCGHMFATDALARHYAGRALAAGYDRLIDPDLRVFFVLPFEHSEDLADQDFCVERCQDLDAEFLDYAIKHRDVIERFGRFPHRNPMLGRETTPEEQAFLDGGGFAG